MIRESAFRKSSVSAKWTKIKLVDDLWTPESDKTSKWRRLPQDLYEDVVQQPPFSGNQWITDCYSIPTCQNDVIQVLLYWSVDWCYIQ